MSIKFTIVVAVCCAFSTIQAVLGFFVIRDETDTQVVTACHYIWAYNFTAAIFAGVQAVISLFAVLFTILTTDARRKRIVIFYLLQMASLIVFGGIILSRITPECKTLYNTTYPDTWRYFISTFVYASAIWATFILVNVTYCIYTCCINSAKENARSHTHLIQTPDSAV